MALVDISDGGGEFSDPTAVCPLHALRLPEATRRSSGTRTRVHPVTWVVSAALIPLLCWDAWQSLQEAKHSRAAREPLVQIDHGARAVGSVRD